jgi:UDP-GlcNAc:undecaprenyl-phosphate GlcNAc-1-phosphate transferase
VFRYLGVLDVPDKERKLHASPIPRVGGVAILLSYVLAFVLLLCTNSGGASLVRTALPFVSRLLPAAGIAFLTGFIDDVLGLRAWQKMTGQAAAALLAYFGGIQITVLGGQHLAHWASCPVTVFWLIASMNALNLIDGLDGLAVGIGLVATATTVLAAVIQLNVPLALATVPLAGCLLGFLRYNFNPATIFLGDCGSLFVGFMLGCFAVIWSEKSATALGMVAPMVALCIPLLDTALAISRRFLRHKSIFSADRGHIHHRLLDLGFSPREVALLLYGVCGIAAVLSLLLANHHHELLILALFLAAVVIGVQRLNYAEFDIAGKMLFEGSFQQVLSAHISLKTFEEKLAMAHTAEECWSILQASHREFGFLDLYAQLGDRTFIDRSEQRGLRSWRLEVPLSPCDCVCLTGGYHAGFRKQVFLPFADALGKLLPEKLALFSQLSSPQVEEANITVMQDSLTVAEFVKS